MAAIKVLYGQQYVVNRLYGHIGSSEHCMEVSRPSWAQPGPTLSTQCGMPKARAFLLVFTTILGVDAVRAGPCVPQVGPVLGPSSAPDATPHRTMLNPTCGQTCPSCTTLDPSWAQVGTNLAPAGPSSAARVLPDLGQVRPSFTPRARFFHLWVRGVLAAKRLKQTIQFLGIPHDYGNPQLSWGLVIS